jgi:hypothetical protein
MKKYAKQDQRQLATWAADCAARVLPFFERAHPEDKRPRQAIEVCRKWVQTGEFRMADIRGASLAAHAAAREAKGDEAGCLAARAAGQAVATAHVPQHAFGAAYYALKAVAAATIADAEHCVVQEYDWQVQHISAELRPEVLKRVVIEDRKGRIFITIHKDEDY